MLFVLEEVEEEEGVQGTQVQDLNPVVPEEVGEQLRLNYFPHPIYHHQFN
jgi:hypothetical protein